MSELKPPETIWLLFNGENNPDGEWLWCEDADPTGDYREGEDSFKYQRQPHPDTKRLDWLQENIDSAYTRDVIDRAILLRQAMEQEK